MIDMRLSERARNLTPSEPRRIYDEAQKYTGVIDRYAANCDCIRLSCIQFITASILVSILVPVAGEAVVADKICAAMPYLIFCGIGSSALRSPCRWWRRNICIRLRRLC